MSIANTSVCASSFEEFMYRFWLENVLWFKLSGGSAEATFTAEERRYLAYISQHNGDQPPGES